MAAECSVLLAVPGWGPACGACTRVFCTTSAAMQPQCTRQKEMHRATPARALVHTWPQEGAIANATLVFTNALHVHRDRTC